MRARDPPGGAYGADDVALSHRLAHANIDGIEVRQDGRHSKAVIDHHRAPGEVQVRLGQGDDTVGRAVDGCPGIGSDVDPVVGASRLSIEHPAAAVNPRNGADNRPDEAPPIVGLIGIQSPDGSDPGILLSNTRQGFRARGHHAIGQAIDPLGFVSPCSHLERHRLPRSVRIADMESCLRGRVAAKPEDETAVAGYPHRSFVQAYPRSRGRRSKGETALDQVIELMVTIGLLVLLSGLLLSAGAAAFEQVDRQRTERVLDLLELTVREWEQLADRQLTWWNGTPNVDGPYESGEIHASTPEVYILSEMLDVIARPASTRRILQRIDDAWLHTLQADDRFAWLPGGQVAPEFVGSLTVVDPWGMPIYATHPGREWTEADEPYHIKRDDDGTIRTENERRYGVCQHRQIVFVSAGADRRFGLDHEFDHLQLAPAQLAQAKRRARRDNLYSAPVVFKYY